MLILWRGSWPNPCAIFLLSLMCLLFMISTQSNFISIRFLNPELYSWGITWHLYLLSPYRSQTKYVPHWTHVYDRLYLSSHKICFGKKNEKHMRNRVAVLFIILWFFLETGICVKIFCWCLVWMCVWVVKNDFPNLWRNDKYKASKWH